MTKQPFRLYLFLLICLSIPLTVTAQTVDIPDPNLRAAIENALDKASGATITTADMANLTELTARNANISNLTGLEAATNLKTLNLGAERVAAGWINSNSVSDLSPLAELNNLTELYLFINNISDISPLAGLNNLTTLDLGFNSISDVSSLAELNNLTTLSLSNNSISDISPLAGLNNLTLLYLSSNNISDISPLAGLNNLTTLRLNNNSISDISPLAGLNNLTTLRLNNNSISDISPLVANTGLGEGDQVDVRENPLNYVSINTHIPALRSRGVIFSVDISDPNLRAAIENALDKASGATITTADMANLTELTARNANISNLTGLEAATNLKTLNLGAERVAAGWINSNSVSDLSPLAELNNLTELYLFINNISDISPLAGLNNLTTLDLGFNSISDVSSLAELNNLTTLSLSNNSISDISPLAGLNNLTLLYLSSNNISDISPLAGLNNLTTLRLNNNSISDISPLAGLNNLTTLRLNNNSISDISPLVANTGLGEGDQVDVRENPLNYVSINTHIPALRSRGVIFSVDISDPNLRAAIENALDKASGATITTADMANLTELTARNANISNLTGLEAATNLKTLNLGAERVAAGWINSNSVSDLSPLAELNNLTELYLFINNISDISPLAGLNNLTTLDLGFNSISDVSSLAELNNLTTLSLSNNSISDISPLAGLNNLTLLYLSSNNISDISPLAGLNNLTTLRLNNNSISDISPLAGLNNLTTLRLNNNSISDISPLVANTGLGRGGTVNVSENPLNDASINTHIPTLQRRGVEVRFENLKSTDLEYLLSIPAGISLIHLPLQVTTINGVAKTITSIADLYDVLGGADTVNFLITYDSQTQEWRSYFGASDTGTPADRALIDDIGIIAGMTFPLTIRLGGNPLGTDGSSTITLNPGLNLVGLPLNDSRVMRVSNLFALDGIGGNVPVIILTDGGEFKAVGRAEDPGDIEITGGQAFIMTAQRAATVTISGDGWTNTSGTAAAPPLSLTGIEVGDTTPVLGLRGSIVEEETGVNQAGLRVTVKNLSTGRAVAAVTAADEAGYRLTVVDIETGCAATVGDILEISAQSPNPFIGVKPLRYTVTAEDVKQSLIQLPELVAYEIPAETQLMPNYPNPFNPETWIPYRLAEDAFVTLTIYDQTGHVVRTIDVGHQIASVYENRSKAIYWDGRNQVGEQVASGVYFYHLSAGDYSATRKMLILK